MASVQDSVNAKLYDCTAMQGHKKAYYTVNAGGATLSLDASTAPVVLCDPGGVSISLLLPPEVDCEGVTITIYNTADALETITVKDAANVATIVTLGQNKGGYLFCDGVTWRGFVGGIT